mgnify:CR=1 FL=1
MGSGDFRLIAGLGNPGSKFLRTRHNIGFMALQKIAANESVLFNLNKKLFGNIAEIGLGKHKKRLLMPNTFMNESGRSVAAYSSFFKISSKEILVAHDDLDIPAGAARFKMGGGHGGHNGLRDIIYSLGNDAEFSRLRIGIGHPGSADKVTSYVLSRPSDQDKQNINLATNEAISLIPILLKGNITQAMSELHGKTFSEKDSSSNP